MNAARGGVRKLGRERDGDLLLAGVVRDGNLLIELLRALQAAQLALAFDFLLVVIGADQAGLCCLPGFGGGAIRTVSLP